MIHLNRKTNKYAWWYFLLSLLILFNVPDPQILNAQTGSITHLSLEQAISRFVQNSPELLAARAEVVRVSEEAKVETLWPNPSLEIEQERFDRNGQEFIILYQEIRNPGEIRLRRESARSLSEAAQAEYQEQVGSLLLELHSRYIDASAAQERLNVILEINTVVQKAYAEADIRVQQGDLSSFDLNRLAVAVTSNEDEFLQVENDYQTALRALLSYISITGSKNSIEVGTVILDSLTYEPSVLDYTTLREQALSQRGLVRAARTAALADTLTFRAEQAARFPELSIQGGFTGEPDVHASTSAYIGIGIGLPVWNSRGPQIGAARAAMQRSSAELMTAMRDVDFEVQTACDHVENYAGRFERISEQMSRSQQLLPDALYLYSEGELSSFELLDAVSALQETALLRIELLQNYELSKYKLDQATGVFSSGFDLSNAE